VWLPWQRTNFRLDDPREEGYWKVSNEFLTADELEVWTGIPQSTWRYWAHLGSGPASFKIGRRRVWKRATVDAWLADQEKNGTTTTG